MSAKKRSSGSQPALQLLLVGREEQRSALQEILHSQASFTEVQFDDVSQLSDVQAKLASKLYDLVVFAQREPETETAQWIEMLRLQDRKVPVLFVPALPTLGAGHDDRPPENASASSESSLIRTIQSAVALARGEHQRREVEDTFRTLYSAVEQSADMVLITDSSGVIEYVNPAFEKLTGYSRPEVLGQTPRILKSGEQGPELYRELWGSIGAGNI